MEFGDFELTPLGERRPRLPLQRKVKQLQRPWQSAIPGARVVPNRFRWASSQQRIDSKDPPATRPRSGAPTTAVTISRLGVGAGTSNNCSSLTSRRRPSTGPPQATSGQGIKATNARPNYYQPVSSQQGLQPPAVRWDGTSAADALTPRGHQARKKGIVRSSINSYRLDSGGPGGVKYLAEKKSVRQTFSGDACALHSPLSTASFFASVWTDTTTDDHDTTTNDHDHGHDATTTDPQRKGNSAWQQTSATPNTTTQNNLVVTAKPAAVGGNGLAFNTPGGSTGSRPVVPGVRQRPSSASGSSSVQRSFIPHPSSTPRPQTVGARNASRPPFAPTYSSEGSRDVSRASRDASLASQGVTGAGGDTLAGQLAIRGTESGGEFSTSCGAGQLEIRGTESGGDFSTSCGEEGGRSAAGSSVGGRVSVSVVLPVLEKETDSRDDRFQSGPATETRAIGDSAVGYLDKVGEGPGVVGVASKVANPAPHHQLRAKSLVETLEHHAKTGLAATNIADFASNTGELGGDNDPLIMNYCRGSDANVGVGRVSAAVPRTQSPHIGALGYYVGEDSGSSRLIAKTSLHGKALVGSHCYTAGSSKRPYTPAITPGEQPYGASHPLSPTSMGSPPRRHRNSNWGEEGMRLAREEEENSRRTAPYIVSGTMLGWKLSTRGRKKSLEDSLKASDYSEHHLIPVYGFRCNDQYGQHTGTGDEKRRVELRRLEARALAAERTALERRAKAEGGAGGAAFARAMSRRALARAELVQKMGDVLDVRKENVCRGSSPEVVRAYRKHVRDRVHGERNRRRTARGLPVRRPTRITAVTSRADLAGSERLASEVEHPVCEGEGGDESNKAAAATALADGLTDEEDLGIEPYLLLVRAKHRQEEASVGGGNKGVVPFCAGCLGGCKGLCSPAAGGAAKPAG